MAANVGGYSAGELAAYERQVALSKMGLMHHQRMGMVASQAVYDGGYSGVAAQPPPPLYYQ